MSRVFVYRLVIGLVALAAFFLLTSILYEVVVAARWNPALPGEGKNRWALLQLQNSRRDPASLLIAWEHFFQRVRFPATQLEALIRLGIAGGITLGLAAVLTILSFVMRKPTHHGNARFGNVMDAEKKGLLAKGGLLLGRMSGATVGSDDPSHVLVVGPTRSGKGVSFVIPNGYMWRGSAVWFDPKREIFEAIGAHRQELGDKVFMFSPGERDSHRYNPLDFIRRDERMPTDAAVVASFIIPEGQGSSEIWARTGRQLLTALIGYVVASERTEGKRHLRSVANLTASGIEFLKVLTNIRKSEGDSLPGWVVQSFNQFIALEKETRNSAFFNVTAAMNPWTNDLIAASTSTTDFDIRELRREPMAIFIGCSIAQLEVFRPIIKMLIQQVHDVLMTSMPGPDEPHQVLVMIDEFRQLGKMESIVSKLTINAGYGFRMVLVLQDLAQLDELYGKATRQTTVSACQVKLFIRMNDLETSEYVSEMLGSTTIEIRTPIIRGGQGIFATRDKSVSYQERALRTAEELRQMPSDRAIVLVPNAPGFMVKKFTYYSEAPFKAIYKRFLGRKLKVPPLPAWNGGATPAGDAAARAAAGRGPQHVPDLLEPSAPPSVENSEPAPVTRQSVDGWDGRASIEALRARQRESADAGSEKPELSEELSELLAEARDAFERERLLEGAKNPVGENIGAMARAGSMAARNPGRRPPLEEGLEEGYANAQPPSEWEPVPESDTVSEEEETAALRPMVGGALPPSQPSARVAAKAAGRPAGTAEQARPTIGMTVRQGNKALQIRSSDILNFVSDDVSKSEDDLVPRAVIADAEQREKFDDMKRKMRGHGSSRAS